ncbi:MAG: hypothetical protein ACXADY_24855 [Candidatus Hodarchaeales archaeon]|jgi:hypothetical protein
MIEIQERWTSFIRLRTSGWRLLYFQNILIVIAALLLFPQFVLFFLSWRIGDVFGGIVNLIFTFAIILDLVAIFLICIGWIIWIYYSRPDQSVMKLSVIIFIFGLVWIVFSLLWRIPFFVNGPYNIGFAFKHSNMENHLAAILPSDPILVSNLILTSIILLLFLYLNDILIFSSNNSFSSNSFKNINIGSFYGIFNLLGAVLALYFITSSIISEGPEPTAPLWLGQVGIIFKLILTPLLGMRASRKYLTYLMHEDKVRIQPVSFFKSIITWLFQIWQIKDKIPVFPNKKVVGMLGSVLLIILIIPFSPFSLKNLTPQPNVIGPYIYREYQSNEAKSTLQYVESLDLSELVTYRWNEYFVDNRTLNFILERMNSGISIEEPSFHPYSYKFIWNVSVNETEFPTLNLSTFQLDWFSIGLMGCFVWWENGTRYELENPDEMENIDRTEFLNVSIPVKWVFYGSFEYSETFGELGGHDIKVKQLIYLSEDNDILCIACSHEHSVA